MRCLIFLFPEHMRKHDAIQKSEFRTASQGLEIRRQRKQKYTLNDSIIREATTQLDNGK